MQLLQWSQQFEQVVWLDSNDYPQKYSNYDALLAVDALTSIQTDAVHAFEKLHDYYTQANDWIFGYLTYDLKNDTENLESHNFDGLDFPELFFFQPKKLIAIKENKVEMHYLNMVAEELEEDLLEIRSFEIKAAADGSNKIELQPRLDKSEYLEKVEVLLEHIQRGDVYEANFCQEFYANTSLLSPVNTFLQLNALSKTPFSAFLKNQQFYALSASPERYLKKEGYQLISQPIKGTAARSSNPATDARLKNDLEYSKKERSENIMIVDLVRNDLSHTAIKGSVVVEELCKIYTFDQVHQMISTITARVDDHAAPVEILKTTFPMGSMTGAPKIAAMKIIEKLEKTKRGLYSGAIGYFTPTGDFDFNVVIRSILYNAKNEYLSYSVGSAITAKSQPLDEYQECLVKAFAMKQVLEN